MRFISDALRKEVSKAMSFTSDAEQLAALEARYAEEAKIRRLESQIALRRWAAIRDQRPPHPSERWKSRESIAAAALAAAAAG